MTLSSAVLHLTLTTPTFPTLPVLFVYSNEPCAAAAPTADSPLYTPVNKFVWGVIEQVHVIQIN